MMKIPQTLSNNSFESVYYQLKRKTQHRWQQQPAPVTGVKPSAAHADKLPLQRVTGDEWVNAYKDWFQQTGKHHETWTSYVDRFTW
jgi:hypothetical protein